MVHLEYNINPGLGFTSLDQVISFIEDEYARVLLSYPDKLVVGDSSMRE